jgi:hypothetical protein
MMTHYSTFEHYNDNIQITKKKIYKKPECFICYEIINKPPIRLKNNRYYQQNCSCNCWIHKKCLDSWYNIKQTCPICRINIIKNTDMLVKISKFNYKLYLLIIFIQNNNRIIKNTIRIFKNCLYYILFLLLLFKLYQNIIFLFVHEIYKYQ